MRVRGRKLGLSLAAAALLLASSAAGLGARSFAEPESSIPACAAPEAWQADLVPRLDAVLSDPRLWGARVGLTVRSATSGELLYSRNGDKPFVPASNQKLVTAAAALAALGPDHQLDPEGPPLSELLVPLLKRSDNGIAERLLNRVGPHAVADFLSEVGVDTRRVMPRDGSGLSSANLIAPEDLTQLLFAVQREPWFPLLHAALPVAGIRDPLEGGTLSFRMFGTPAQGNVRAKTGTLDRASALSGYVTSACGEPLIFSVLINDFYGPTAPKTIEDRLAAALAS